MLTHNMQRAVRVHGYTAYMSVGGLIEIGVTGQVNANPRLERMEDCASGRYG